jgi:hypothetical protein
MCIRVLFRLSFYSTACRQYAYARFAPWCLPTAQLRAPCSQRTLSSEVAPLQIKVEFSASFLPHSVTLGVKFGNCKLTSDGSRFCAVHESYDILLRKSAHLSDSPLSSGPALEASNGHVFNVAGLL